MAIYGRSRTVTYVMDLDEDAREARVPSQWLQRKLILAVYHDVYYPTGHAMVLMPMPEYGWALLDSYRSDGKHVAVPDEDMVRRLIAGATHVIVT